MICDKHGATMYEAEYSSKENYICPQCEIEELKGELASLKEELEELKKFLGIESDS
jgi:superfamily II helicase